MLTMQTTHKAQNNATVLIIPPPRRPAAEFHPGATAPDTLPNQLTPGPGETAFVVTNIRAAL